MARKSEEIGKDRADGSITQFIIECLFRKYFEEKKDDKVKIEKEEVRV